MQRLRKALEDTLRFRGNKAKAQPSSLLSNLFELIGLRSIYGGKKIKQTANPHPRILSPRHAAEWTPTQISSILRRQQPLHRPPSWKSTPLQSLGTQSKLFQKAPRTLPCRAASQMSPKELHTTVRRPQVGKGRGRTLTMTENCASNFSNFSTCKNEPQAARSPLSRCRLGEDEPGSQEKATLTAVPSGRCSFRQV